MRLARTAAVVADGLYLVIATMGAQMETSTSPLQASARETLTALDEIRRHQQLLAPPWRGLLDAATRRLEQLRDGRHDHMSLRAARATTATAAGEAAQAARFQAQLLRLAPDELASARTQLESHVDSVRSGQNEAAAHLNAAVERMLAELEERQARRGRAGGAAAVARVQAGLTDDVVRAMRAYADRIEQLLLDLAGAVRSVFGLSMGTALPTRVPREPPRPDLDRIAVTDAARLPIELADAVWRSVELYQERLDERIDDAIRALRSRLGRAADHSRLDEQRTRARIIELTLEAKELERVAERLDWMLPIDCAAPARR